MTTVLKFGGDLLEDRAALHRAAAAVVRLSRAEPVVVVHGGGRAIDAELRARNLTPTFADGLRVTDEAVLESVIAVLAGRTNTAFVAAIGSAGARAVGLTGADGLIGLSSRTEAFDTVAGDRVDLGLVGQPDGDEVSLLRDLLHLGYVPVIASIGISRQGELLNVNADTLAGHLAAALRARRLIIAGRTAGVLDAEGTTIGSLTPAAIDGMTASGAAHSGMVAKLVACRRALEAGVTDVTIVSGRGVEDFGAAPGTRIREERMVNSD